MANKASTRFGSGCQSHTKPPITVHHEWACPSRESSARFIPMHSRCRCQLELGKLPETRVPFSRPTAAQIGRQEPAACLPKGAGPQKLPFHFIGVNRAHEHETLHLLASIFEPGSLELEHDLDTSVKPCLACMCQIICKTSLAPLFPGCCCVDEAVALMAGNGSDGRHGPPRVVGQTTRAPT